MSRHAWWSLLWLWIWACGSDHATPPPAAPPPPPPAAPPPSAPAVAPTNAPNPCDTPGPLTLELSAGVMQTTPWGLEFTYALDEDKKRGSGFMFLLRSGERRWET